MQRRWQDDVIDLAWERRQQLFHRKMGNVREKERFQVQKRQNQRTKQIRRGKEVTSEKEKQKEARNWKNLKEHWVDFFGNVNNHSFFCYLHSNSSHLCQQHIGQNHSGMGDMIEKKEKGVEARTHHILVPECHLIYVPETHMYFHNRCFWVSKFGWKGWDGWLFWALVILLLLDNDPGLCS